MKELQFTDVIMKQRDMGSVILRG